MWFHRKKHASDEKKKIKKNGQIKGKESLRSCSYFFWCQEVF